MESLSVAKIGPPRRFQSMEFHYDADFPTNGGFYFSAPTSPKLSSANLSDFAKSIRAVVPFMWEEKPGTPKKNGDQREEDDDDEFSEDGSDFEFSAGFEGPNSEVVLSTAEELFSGGQIRPLRPPPGLGFDFEKANGSFKTLSSFNGSTPQSPRSPRSPLKEGQRMVKEAIWGLANRMKGRGKGKDFDPFAAALEETKKDERRGRGRERSAGRRCGRSCSPLGIFKWKRDGGEELSRRWRLKDFFSRRKEKRAFAFRISSVKKQSEKQGPFRKFANHMEYRLVKNS